MDFELGPLASAAVATFVYLIVALLRPEVL
jgi:K+-transporting ATPase KdpF subunit